MTIQQKLKQLVAEARAIVMEDGDAYLVTVQKAANKKDKTAEVIYDSEPGQAYTVDLADFRGVVNEDYLDSAQSTKIPADEVGEWLIEEWQPEAYPVDAEEDETFGSMSADDVEMGADGDEDEDGGQQEFIEEDDEEPVVTKPKGKRGIKAKAPAKVAAPDLDDAFSEAVELYLANYRNRMAYASAYRDNLMIADMPKPKAKDHGLKLAEAKEEREEIDALFADNPPEEEVVVKPKAKRAKAPAKKAKAKTAEEPLWEVNNGLLVDFEKKGEGAYLGKITAITPKSVTVGFYDGEAKRYPRNSPHLIGLTATKSRKTSEIAPEDYATYLA